MPQAQGQSTASAADTSTGGDVRQAKPGGAPPQEQAAPPVSAEAAQKAALKALLNFHLYGQRPPGTRPLARDRWPALLHAFRDFRAIRHDFPLCLPPAGQDGRPRPLSRVIDEFVEASRDEGDGRERFRRHLYQLELEVKRLAESQPKAGLDTLLGQAGEILLAASKLDDDKRTALAADLAEARRGLPQHMGLVACGANAPRRLFTAVYETYWAEHCAAWRAELSGLISALGDVLRADSDRQPQARSAPHLRNTLGTGDRNDVDADRLADMLHHAHLSEPLPEARRERIQKTLEVLKRLQPVFGGAPASGASKSELPFPLAPVAGDCAASQTRRRLQSGVLLEFFKSVRIAQLELENRYRESVHDAFFAEFDASHLSPEERGLCPPVILQLSQSKISGQCAGQLIDLLMSGFPFKIVLQLDSVAADPDDSEPRWPACLGDMARSLPGVFVLQTPVSRIEDLLQGFEAGLRHPGPALYAVYTGREDGAGTLPSYLDAAAAMEARVFPAFQLDPAQGQELARCMRQLGNAQPEHNWAQEQLAVQDPDGEQQERTLAFTPLDFLLTDTRLAEHFWAVAPDGWHERMQPLADYLAVSREDRERDIPYILAVSAEGTVERVVATRSLVDQIGDFAARWRRLQEDTGVSNSHAAAALAAEQAAMEARLQADVARIQDEHDERLGKGLGELTREIVERIASQLAHGALAPSAPAVAPARPVAKAEPAEAVAEPAAAAPVDEEEDEALTLDDPYIDTPLCTACDDCTRMSPMMFAYNEDKQAIIKDARAGTFQELVLAAEKCPVKIIHPGKPWNPNEANLEEWIKRAEPFQ